MASNLKKRGLENEIKGGVKEIAGKARQKIGKAVGSKTQQRKGIAKELEGKVQKALGQAQRQIAADDDS